MKLTALSDWLAQQIERDSKAPIYRQLHQLVRKGILDQTLKAGSKMPASRVLASELDIARNTVLRVYEDLVVEGYLEGRPSSGTYVAALRADDKPFPVPRVPLAPAPYVPAEAILSKRGKRLLESYSVSEKQGGAFMPGVPDVSYFPAAVWARLQSQHWNRPRRELMTYSPPGGLARLREVLCDYLQTSRSVRCTPEQVILTTGIHQSIDLTIRLLTDASDRIWTEDPCYWGVRSVIQMSDLNIVPVHVDAHGLCPTEEQLTEPPTLMLVTPSHQYPLGQVMSLARRDTLLDYARDKGSWIVEDDYDSEFRYDSPPLPCLQGLDTGARVIYVGSFSKTLFPGLRIGYIVVPATLADTFAKASAELYREGQLAQQSVLADFIAEGHFTTHIRRMRDIYRTKRDLLSKAIETHFQDTLKISGHEAGLHLVLHLPNAIDDVQLTKDALRLGILVRPLSDYYSHRQSARKGLLLGYACVPAQEITPLFAQLARLIKAFGVSTTESKCRR